MEGGPTRGSGSPVKKLADGVYELLCGVCRRGAVSVRVGPRAGRGPDWDGEGLLVDGARFRDTYGTAHAERVFALLEAGDVEGVHRLLWDAARALRREEWGLRSFCPDCGMVYCEEHRPVREIYEEWGFYDRSTATCPRGHTREVDD